MSSGIKKDHPFLGLRASGVGLTLRRHLFALYLRASIAYFLVFVYLFLPFF